MQFIKKKNLLEREELHYVPALHWMYVAKPVTIALIIITAFFVSWSFVPKFIGLFFHEFLIYFVLLSVGIMSFILAVRIYLYQTIEYGVTNKRLLIKRGVFKVITAEIPSDRIESIYCLQSLCGRIFNYGTICISGIGGMMPVFYMVNKPYALRRRIVDIIEKNKMIHIIRGDLPKPKPVAKPEPIKEDPLMWGTFVKMN